MPKYKTEVKVPDKSHQKNGDKISIGLELNIKPIYEQIQSIIPSKVTSKREPIPNARSRTVNREDTSVSFNSIIDQSYGENYADRYVKSTFRTYMERAFEGATFGAGFGSVIPGGTVPGIIIGGISFVGFGMVQDMLDSYANNRSIDKQKIKSAFEPNELIYSDGRGNDGNIVSQASIVNTAVNTVTKTLVPYKDFFQPDSLSYAQYAKTITTEATPALEALNEQVENNNFLMQSSSGQFGALVDSYFDYSQMVDTAANSINMLTEAEAAAATSRSTTTQVLTKALNEAQTKVNSLAGDSLVQLSNAFAGAIVKGESFGDALKSMGENILYTIIQMQALSWITGLFGGTGGMEKFGAFTPSNSILNLSSSSPFGAWGSVVSAIFNAKGNIFGPQGLKAFAKGGIVSKPTIFGFAKGIGLMGEAGAEAIMPLGRDSRGNLGVRIADSAISGTGTGGVFAPHVEINVENKGGGDMSEEQARTLGTQVKAIVEMQVAKQMYEYMRNGTLRPSMGRGY